MNDSRLQIQKDGSGDVVFVISLSRERRYRGSLHAAQPRRLAAGNGIANKPTTLRRQMCSLLLCEQEKMAVRQAGFQ